MSLEKDDLRNSVENFVFGTWTILVTCAWDIPDSHIYWLVYLFFCHV